MTNEHRRLDDPAAHIKALVWGFPSPLRENRLLAMLVGYVDDSGSEPNGLVYVLAGFISTADKWERFSDEWASLCAKDPQTPDFKMAIAEHLKGGGTYWGQGTDAELAAKRDAKVYALAELVKKYAMCRISAGMDWGNYQAFAKGRVPCSFDSPYFFLFWELIVAVAQYQEKTRVREKVDFVFDDQGVIGETAASWHSKLIATLSPFPREIISCTPIFRNDTAVLPLKAADMLAWQIRRNIYDLKENRSGAVQRPALKLLLGLPGIQANITKDMLRYIVREINHVGVPDLGWG